MSNVSSTLRYFIEKEFNSTIMLQRRTRRTGSVTANAGAVGITFSCLVFIMYSVMKSYDMGVILLFGQFDITTILNTRQNENGYDVAIDSIMKTCILLVKF